MAEYEAVIGLETHIQLNTQSKVFCACKADSWDDTPNTNICPVCTGLPGVLPVLNKDVAEKAVILAEAMHSAVQPVSCFDRKNYFYPDLPKGYQISQFDMPLARGGLIDLPIPASADPAGKGYVCRVRINRLHIEEDAGKTKNDGRQRLVDFNRCGVPLVEMVTEPDLRTADEAAQYLIRLRQLLRWLGISDADMEKGNLRCDANVSIRVKGSAALNQKTEIKNVNSIDAVRDAIRKEIERQKREVAEGKPIEAWTLEWDEDTESLRKMRSKETEADYRYFREPDLLPLEISPEWKKEILAEFPELPLERRSRFMTDFKLPEYDADILTLERGLSDYFEKAAKAYTGETKKVSNWLMNDVLRMVNDQGLNPAEMKLTPEYLAELISLVDAGAINITTGKALLQQINESGKAPKALVEEQGLAQVTDDSAIRAACQKVVDANPNEVVAFKVGKETLMGWFVGQVMREMKGKADAKITGQILKELLS
ncbi:MAG: Asp-tRNA(Asn)/Glu-tRNA(Gln) amidotransferase subunit GatB [Anaerolineaceae bacterium]|nr:Asp-tRNA(Asn)/Glu-tRNA(Gln) amidotransferase subunit GatB [Anaerolineaceae bacterium]